MNAQPVVITSGSHLIIDFTDGSPKGKFCVRSSYLKCRGLLTLTVEQIFKYEVALSFAGEQRSYVQRVSRSLKGLGVSCFYDSDEIPTLWGTNGVETLSEIYGASARYVVMFTSKKYVDKPWCKIERRAALASRMDRKEDSVLQVAFDRVKVPGMPPGEIFVEAKNFEPEQLALLICKKIGVDLSTRKASLVASPSNVEDASTVRFGYGTYGGRTTIGVGDWSFELHFTRADSQSIHLYSDTPSVRGIALVDGARECSDVRDADVLDFLSPNLTAHIGCLVVLQNHFGFYALIRIEYIADKSRGSETDELIFSYRILRNRDSDFRQALPFEPLVPSIALKFDVANEALSIQNTFNEPIKWYLTATDSSGFPPPPNDYYRDQVPVILAPGKWTQSIEQKFEMTAMPPRSVQVSHLHMDVYVSDMMDDFYRIRFILKMTCRGKTSGESVLISVESRWDSVETL